MMIRRAFLATAFAAALMSTASAATVKYAAHLTGAREVPKTDSKGTGRLEATYDSSSKLLSYTLTYKGLSGPASAAHFHGPASRGENAGVLAPIGDKNPPSPLSGTVTLTDDQATALSMGKIYVNVHTVAHPGGEIRGQVMHASMKKRSHGAAKTTSSTAMPPAASSTPASPSSPATPTAGAAAPAPKAN